MKRRKKHLTAKALTLRLAVVALAMVLLACLLGLYTPFPSQVIDQREKEFATGPLEVLDSQQFDAYRAYLSGNDHCLNLLFCRFTVFGGWGNYGGTILDLSQEEGPLWVDTAMYTGARNIEDGAFYDNHLFGRVDVDGAKSVRVLFPSWEDGQPLELPLFLGEDSHWYFWGWHTVQWEDWEADYFDIDVEVLDSAGNVLYTYETLPSYTEEELAG